MSLSSRFLRTALTSALLCVVLTVSASALTYGNGVVTGSALHLREEAGTNARILTTAARDTRVVVLENQKDGWYKVDLEGTVGYMSAEYLSVTPQTYTGTPNTDGASLNMRSGPGTDYNKVGSIPATATLTITAEENGWYKTSYEGVTGYVSSEFVDLDGVEKSSEPQSEEQPQEQLEEQLKNEPVTYTGTLNTNGRSLNLRSGPGNDYDKVGSIPASETLTIITEENGWYKTSYNGVFGYVSGDYVVLSESKANSVTYTGVPNTEGRPLNMRSGPGTDYERINILPSGTSFTFIGEENGWYKISFKGMIGYVLGEFVTLSEASSQSSSQSSSKGSSQSSSQTSSQTTQTSTGSGTTASSSSSSDLGSQVVAYAKKFLGIPYVYGANGPNSYDCSSFTQTVFKHFGYSLNRSAAGQYSNGTAIDLSNVRVGDLLIWRAYGSSKTATHVGIYIGNNMYIHASSSGGCITINNMDYASGYRYLVGVRRILA